MARVIGTKLSERLGGRAVVIENRTGGGTVIGAHAVARAAPDGHTLLFAPSGTLTTNVALYKSLPYDPVKDFVPVALYNKIPFVLVVHPSLPVQSIGDLVKVAKTQKLSYASTGTGAVPHMAGELLKSMTGIEMTHVPYRGVTQTLTDVIAGHVQMTFASPESAMPRDQGRPGARARRVVVDPRAGVAGRGAARRERPAGASRRCRGTWWSCRPGRRRRW